MDIIQEIDDLQMLETVEGVGSSGRLEMTNVPSNICPPPAPCSALTFKWRTPATVLRRVGRPPQRPFTSPCLTDLTDPMT